MSRFTFPRNLSKQRAMVRLSIHRRANQIDDVIRQAHSTQEVLARMYLYMPPSIQVNDGLTYENVDLSNLLGMGADIFNAARNRISGNDSGDINVDAATTYATTQVAGSGGVVGGAASQALIQKGKVLNPRTQMLFKGPVLRQFSFTFKFIPSNKQEADDIYEMIKTIRLHSYPDTEGLTEGSEGVFTFPDIFRIEFITNPTEEEFSSGGGSSQLKMVRLGDTYCTAISTNYNPTSPSFYGGGYPAEVDLTLTFQETKVVTRNDIKNRDF
jgi:hypothetical protein